MFFSQYLADGGEVSRADVQAVQAQREDRGQSHHTAHCSHVVQVGLGVLDVPAATHTYTLSSAFLDMYMSKLHFQKGPGECLAIEMFVSCPFLLT